MKIPVRPRGFGLRFNITPLIDVVFLLIIFFLAATHLVRTERLEAIELPRATRSDDEKELPRRIIVTVSPDGSVRLGERMVGMKELESVILASRAEHGAELEVRIRADRRAEYAHIEPILLACSRANVTHVGFVVLPE